MFFEAKQLGKFLTFVENNSASERNTVNLFIEGIKIKIDFPYIFVTAPYRQLNELLEGNKSQRKVKKSKKASVS